MNVWIYVVILAVVQGIAEFLPISSSGHLAVLGTLFGFREDRSLALGIVLHAGSLLAILVFYFRTLLGFFRKEQFHLLLMVIVGTIPAGLAGVALKLSGLDEKLMALFGAGTEDARQIAGGVVQADQVHTYENGWTAELKQVLVADGSAWAGQSIKNSGIRERYHCMVVGVETPEGVLEKPKPDRVFRAGDIIWLVGEKDALAGFLNARTD